MQILAWGITSRIVRFRHLEPSYHPTFPPLPHEIPSSTTFALNHPSHALLPLYGGSGGAACFQTKICPASHGAPSESRCLMLMLLVLGTGRRRGRAFSEPRCQMLMLLVGAWHGAPPRLSLLGATVPHAEAAGRCLARGAAKAEPSRNHGAKC